MSQVHAFHSHLIYLWYILTLFTLQYPGLPSELFPCDFLTKKPECISVLSRRVTSHSPWFDHSNNPPTVVVLYSVLIWYPVILLYPQSLVTNVIFKYSISCYPFILSSVPRDECYLQIFDILLSFHIILSPSWRMFSNIRYPVILSYYPQSLVTNVIFKYSISCYPFILSSVPRDEYYLQIFDILLSFHIILSPAWRMLSWNIRYPVILSYYPQSLVTNIIFKYSISCYPFVLSSVPRDECYLQIARDSILSKPSAFTECGQPLILFDTKISLCTAVQYAIIDAERFVALFVSHINFLQARLLITEKPSL